MPRPYPAALATFPGWPTLWKALVTYGFAARVPVAILMFFAFAGNWHTHYNAPPPDVPAGMGLVAKWVWLELIPQLTFWVGFTIIVEMFFGSLTSAVVRLSRPSAQSA